MEVWVIKTDWATNDETGSDVTLYANEATAKMAFEKAVKDELELYYSNVELDDKDCGYTMLKEDRFFEIYKDGEYLLNHSTISLDRLTVITE